jgi:hypothetical protein
MVENLANAASEVSKLRHDVNDAMPDFLKRDVSEQKQQDNADIMNQIKWNDVEGLTDYQKVLLKDEYGWTDERIDAMHSWEEAEGCINESQKTDLTGGEKTDLKHRSGWSDEIIDNLKNIKQCEILESAGLIEEEINERKCLIKENIDFDYTDEDGVSNRDRMTRGLAPLDSVTGKPIELHHLGQKADSPLVELTEEEHRTGEYEDGKKNQSLWHDNTIDSEVHGDGNSWFQERKAHWKARAEQSKE